MKTRIQPSHRGTGAWLPGGLWAVSILFAGLDVFLLILNRDAYVETRFGARGLFTPTNVGISTVGALILSRQPRNRIGSLLLAVGLAMIAGSFATEYAIYGLLTHPASLPGAEFLAWVETWFWVPLVSSVLILLPLIFPTGSLVTPRWKVVVWLGSVGALVLSITFAFKPGPLDSIRSVANPFGLAGAGELLSTYVEPAGIVILIIGAAAASLSLIVRWRHSAGRERQQIKWVAAAAVMLALTLPAGYFAPTVARFFFLPVSLSLPIAIGFAILRYRLYDIDIIIRRTVTYSILTALLLGVYFGGVVLLQQLFRTVTRQTSEVAIILSTLAIAALFVPLRNRIQNIIDRRFYRRKYDAQKVLAEFARTARDETDLNKLTERLIDVVDETMQPESVSVWLKKTKTK